ncbi:radical SAM family heme chaperone HemW [Caulobacter sp. 17J65-9]|uniref:radical SAM family heme chaperone HemW n=1 Tax=Caulobacter sp. 17J65-9 TaxID=2709382 RepID=UPI0013C98003|nr:coproporphyrinogen III oxidase [Caulobacter sp. 17J65-9]
MSPLALYVHWPYCARICPYCDFNVVRARGREAEAQALADALVQDLRTQAARLGPRRLGSVFFGGGTPSLMDPAWAARIVDEARALFETGPDLEITLEANPTDAEAERFRGFAEAGVQRLSLGLQSLDDEALKFLGRNHDAAEARRAALAAREAFPRLSIDMIYARPGQSTADWTRELEAALDLGPEHVSPYQLTIEAGTAFDRAVSRGRFAPPVEDAAAELFETAQSVLEGAGFEAYEVSNHARGLAARSAHNLAIWRGAEYLGVGPGAHGRVVLGGARTATRGAPAIGEFLKRVETEGVGLDTAEALSPVEAAEERVMLGLRIDEGVAWAELAALDLSPDAERVRDLQGHGLLAPGDERLAATRAGRLVLDGVLRALLT